jgi:hypothetical protein
MQTLEQLSPTDAQGILDDLWSVVDHRLPKRIRTALIDDQINHQLREAHAETIAPSTQTLSQLFNLLKG